MVLPTTDPSVTVWTSSSPYKVVWQVFGTVCNLFPGKFSLWLVPGFSLFLPNTGFLGGNSSSARPIVSKSESQIKGHRCCLRTCWFLPGQLQHVTHMNPWGTVQVCNGMTEGEWEVGDRLAEVKPRPLEEAYCAVQKSRSQSHVIGTHICVGQDGTHWYFSWR